MRISTHLFIACFALAWTSAASAAVDVTFVHPEHYTDASLHGGYGSAATEATQREITAVFERLGERYLKSGQTLKVAVLDIDLAGRYEPWRRYAYEVRIFREITWPRIKLRYRLEENGTTLSSAEGRYLISII